MNKYFIREQNETKGPFSIKELTSKKVTKETWIWREGLEDWVQVKQLGDEVFVSSSEVGSNLPKSNTSYRNLIIACSVLLFIFIIVVVYNIANEDYIYSSEPHRIKTFESELVLKAAGKKTVKEEKIKATNVKSNYFLSDDETCIYFFDEVEKYWWFKEYVKFLTLKEQCDFNDLTRKHKKFYADTPAWNVVDIPDNVKELNKLYKKDGKFYERISLKAQKIPSTLKSKSVFYNLLQKNEYAQLKSTKEQIRNQFDFILYSNGYDGDTVNLYLSYSVYDPVISDWRFADRKYRFARNDVKFFEWVENRIADDYKRYIKEKKKTEVINFTNNTSTTPVGIFIRLSLLGDFDWSKF